MKLVSFQKGKGENLLFLGGAFTVYNYYDNFISKLAKDFKVHFFNYPGFGGSEKLERHRLIDYLLAISAYVKKNKLSNFYLAGHSFGGYLATKYSARKDDLKALILLEPLTRLRHKSFYKNAQALFKTQMAEEDEGLKTIKKLSDAKVFLDTPEKIKHAQFVIKQKLLKKDIPDDTPILVFLGKNDLVIDNAYSRKIFEKENVKIITLIKGGHLAHNFYPKKIVKGIKLFALQDKSLEI